MNSTVKRYAFRLSQLSEVMGGRLEVVEYSGDGLPYVLAADYDALAAELAAIKGQEVVDCKVVPVESLRRWVTGLQLGIISQRSVVEELRAILEAKDE